MSMEVKKSHTCDRKDTIEKDMICRKREIKLNVILLIKKHTFYFVTFSIEIILLLIYYVDRNNYYFINNRFLISTYLFTMIEQNSYICNKTIIMECSK